MRVLPLFLTILVLLTRYAIGKDDLKYTTVFEQKQDDPKGFAYRIPSLVTTNSGILLAFAERRIGLKDHAQNDIVLRRSLDNGLTWEPLEIIDEDANNSLNDPCAVVLNSGRILLIYQRFPANFHTTNMGENIKIADEGYDGPTNTRSFIRYSDDEGASWSKRRDITKMIRPVDKIHTGCPGIGIQLQKGVYRGRIIIPLYEVRKINNKSTDWQNRAAWSDDEGETWQISDEIPHYGHSGFGNEAQAAELSDGSIMIIARNQGGKFRKYSISRDGGESWSNMKLDINLPGVACMGSVIGINSEVDSTHYLIQSAPADMKFRTRGTIRLSDDDGKSWRAAREVPLNHFAYSCLTVLKNNKIGLLFETDQYRKICFTSFDRSWIEDSRNVRKQNYLEISSIDLSDEVHRQSVVDKEKGQYLGHVTTVLMDDGKTVFAVYPKGHGKGPIVLKQSEDGGKTWSKRFRTPDTWYTSREVPTLFRTEGPRGKRRLIMFSGLYPARMAMSEDGGNSWSELERMGDWGGIVVMGDVIPLNTGRGHYMAMFHDDMRYFEKNGREQYENDQVEFNSRLFTLYKTVSEDGGLTWSHPVEIYKSREKHICEPGMVRSPDGKQIAVLLRENSRRFNSQIIFSDDEGQTWTDPRALPNSLNGDRHTIRYTPDGRIVVVFRDISPARKFYNAQAMNWGEVNYFLEAEQAGFISPTHGDWVAWVGRYEDLVNGNPGQYRIRLKDNKNSWDCAYPGVLVLPDSTISTTTYGHWEFGESPFILNVQFKLEEIDQKAADASN
jgi:photosystem II stability/assembly factor-like uncharacterized protein